MNDIPDRYEWKVQSDSDLSWRDDWLSCETVSIIHVYYRLLEKRSIVVIWSSVLARLERLFLLRSGLLGLPWRSQRIDYCE